MKDFISVLSNYVVQSDDQFEGVFKSLWERAEKVVKDFESWSTDKDTSYRFKVETHTINIPFQIVLVNSEAFTEVVVSFAGRGVLEREKKYGVKGFFSSDPYVVKTFYEVFKTYVQSEGRLPYIPPHTREVSKQHAVIGNHFIPTYYNGLVKNLYVTNNSFSPVIGNSTKFTVWVLEKLLSTGNPGVKPNWGMKIHKVLDVGAGTGILACATSNIIQKNCGRTDYTIVALDSCSFAQKSLEMNCGSDTRISVFPWKLCYQTNQQKEVISSWFQNEAGKSVVIDDQFNKFDLIIGDLPFVHAEERYESDLRFLDLNHSLHQALFKICTSTDLLSHDGLLITAFSSLGGSDDIADFERHIRENSLQMIQRVEFFESDYMWIVYVLMKKDGFNSYGGRLWWQVLDAENREGWKPKTEISSQIS